MLDFWQQVKTNLQAGRVRLLFIADEIPPELRRVVEFLNGQMDPAEVLAIEVKQFVGENLKALVPRVRGRQKWLARRRSLARADTPMGRAIVFRCIRWNDEASRRWQSLDDYWNGREQHGLRIWWGQGTKDGSFFPVYDNGLATTFSSRSGPTGPWRFSSST